MDLDAAFKLLGTIYTRSQRENVHTDELRDALHTILAAHPEVRRELIEYWEATEYRPELQVWERNRYVQACHPIWRVIMRKCGRV